MNIRTTLGEILDNFDSKRVPLNSRQRAERQGHHPYYGAQGIIDHIDGFIFDGRYVLIPEDGENLNSRKLPIAYFATGRFWVNNHAHIVRGRPNKLDDDYLCYWLNNSDIAGFVTGAAQPKLSQGSLNRIEINLPPLHLQKTIAAFLRAYDDLIENNTRRIAVLEEMARRIYEEWFVHFRAPGSETLPRINTPLGPVPEGWEVVRLDQIAEVNPEQISPKYPPDQIAYIDIASVSPGKIDQVVAMPFAEAPGRARRIVRDGDTIWSSVRPNRRSYALVINPEPNWIASTGFAVLRPRGAFSTFLYFATTAESFVSYLVGRATGSAYPAVKASDFEEAALVRPPNELLERFSDCVDPMVRLGANLNRQNRNLRTQRDLLLPKLISGEIDVAEAPAYLEAAE